MIKEKGLLENGCVISEDGQKYYPEGNPLTFGDQTAMITVHGWWTGGTCAVVTWDGKRHILEKNADGLRMSALTVERYKSVH